MSEKNFEQAYNKHFQGQHIKNGIDPSKLIDDDPFQIEYPQSNRIKGFIASALMGCFIDVVGYGASPEESETTSYELQIRKLFEKLKTGSVVIITNHATFVNFPIIILELKRWAKLLGQEKPEFYTILGPALVTQNQKHFQNSISHLLKTIPATKNGTIPGFPNEIKIIRENFVKKTTELAGQPGKIFLISPTGTRDTLHWVNGKVRGIFFSSDTGVRPSKGLIKEIVNQGACPFIVGVNETKLKEGKSERGSDFGPGKAIIGIQEITSDQIDSNLMHSLAVNILSPNGQVIGKDIRPSTLEILKNLKQRESFQSMDEFEKLETKLSEDKKLMELLSNILQAGVNFEGIKEEIQKMISEITDIPCKHNSNMPYEQDKNLQGIIPQIGRKIVNHKLNGKKK